MVAVTRNSLALKGNVNPHAEAALAEAKREVLAGTQSATGLCLQRVRELYGIGPDFPTAIAAFNANKMRVDYTHSWYNPPAGVPVFWSGGSSGDGHIALADGRGNCYSTDIRRAGRFDLVPITEIHATWGLSYVGWTETLNGVRVYN